MHLGPGTQARSNAMWSEEIGEGLGCGRRGHQGKGSTHYRTPTDMTGHDRHNRTQPDTKPDIPDMGTHDTVQNTPDTTGHYRTQTGQDRTQTGQDDVRPCPVADRTLRTHPDTPGHARTRSARVLRYPKHFHIVVVY